MTVPAISVPARWWLLAVLLVSTGLHVWLAAGGGQGYWPDENRYQVSRQVVAAAGEGHWRDAAGHLLGAAGHVFFRFIGLVPAALERLLFPAEAVPPGFAAGFFGLFAVGAIALVWLIAREETKDEPTASWCAFFYAGCVTGFFFTRHYFPYDPAVCILLLGWWLGLRSRSPFQHWRTGVVVGLGYLTYNAYWNLGAVILVFHVLRRREGSSPVARGLWAALGLVTPILVLFAAAHGLGHDLLASEREFSKTVTQGGFGQGWRYIPTYFATAEGAYGGLLALLAGAGIIAGIRQGSARLVWLWPSMGGVLALGMVFFSDLVPRFALSGRMIKPLAVFLALSAGLAAGRFRLHQYRGPALGLGLLAAGLAAWNFRTPLTLTFPGEFRIAAQAVIATERARDPDAPLQMYYADFMHLARFIQHYPPHVVLLQRLHPLQYRPYQFEGFDAPTRRGFQTHDFSMRLVRLTGPTGWQADTAMVGADLHPYAGALEIELDLPFPRPAGHQEPLVVAGSPGQADLLSIRYLDAEQVELLVDHWGWGAVRSAPFRVPAADRQPHRVVVSSGSLLPPASHPVIQADPELLALRGEVVVRWNDREVMREALPLYSSRASAVTVGANLVGGTSAELDFTGRIHRVRQIDPRLVLRRSWEQGGAGLALGSAPIRARFDWDEDAAGKLPAEATVFAARDETQNTRLTLRAQGTGIVFSLWRQDARVAESLPQPLATGSHQLEIWSRSLVPPGEPAADPTLQAWLQENFLLKLDGRPILQHHQPVSSSPGRGEPGSTRYNLLGRSWPLDAPGQTVPFPGRFTRVEPVPLTGPVLLQALSGDRLRDAPFDAGAPGPLRLRLRFPPNRAGGREPLFASGPTGAADVLFVVYEPDGRIRIGHDHWGWALLLSEPIALDPTAEHVLDISIGSLYPADDAAWRPSPVAAGSRVGRLYVAVNGEPVLDTERECYLAPLSSVVFGRNLPGSSTCGPEFTGELLEISRLDPAITRLPAARSDPPRQ